MGQAELDQSDPLGVDPGALETIVAAMRCPICGGTMAWDAPVVRCPEGHAVVTHDGYLDASSAETPDRATAQTFESFGYEWTTFSQSLDEDRDFAEFVYLIAIVRATGLPVHVIDEARFPVAARQLQHQGRLVGIARQREAP